LSVFPAPTPRGRLCKALAAVSAIAVVAATLAFRSDPYPTAHGRALEVVRVSRGEVVKTFTTDGELESSRNVEVTCKLLGGSTILWVVPDGTHVRAGDEVVRFDASMLEDRVGEQMIAVAEARAAEIAAEREQATAAMGVVEYTEGTFLVQQQECDATLAIARMDLVAAEHSLKSTMRLARLGFATPAHREAGEFSVVRARHALAIALRAKSVLQRYNRPKLLSELESRRDTAQAVSRSARAKRELEIARLHRLQSQLARCSVRAPQDGLVIHANDPNHRTSGVETPQIEEGAQVHEHQVILRLPNLKRMQARIVFHESILDHVRPGVPARLTVRDRKLMGVVESVTNQPEHSRRSEAHIKKYAAIVRIDGLAEGLRPGATAEVELLLDHRQGVLTAPLAAVAQQGHEFYAWVRSSPSPERHRVELGTVNDELAEIRWGLAEGDAVVLHPRDVLEEAQRDVVIPDPVDVAKRFGVAPAVPEAAVPSEMFHHLKNHTAAGGE
jgi:HlyD family secretion protein